MNDEDALRVDVFIVRKTYYSSFFNSHDVLGIGNVKTLFGTAPGFWNTLLGAMAQLPSSVLSDEPLMEKLAIFSLPIVRVVDYFAGATNAMRIDVSSAKDSSVKEMALYGTLLVVSWLLLFLTVPTHSNITPFPLFKLTKI